MKDFEDTIAVDLPTIMEVVEQVFGDCCVLYINTHLNASIESPAGNLVRWFDTIDNLYKWITEQQIKLDEQHQQQLKQQAQDHKDSEPTKHRW